MQQCLGTYERREKNEKSVTFPNKRMGKDFIFIISTTKKKKRKRSS